MSKTYLFIDESGTPDFYAKRKEPLWLRDDFAPFMLLGMVETETRKRLRKDILSFQDSILNNPFFNEIPSISKNNWYLHACKDHPEVRIKFFEFLHSLDYYKMYVIIARKKPKIFFKKHNSNPTEFYFDMLSKLFGLLDIKEQDYYLYLAKRQSTTEQRLFNAADNVFKKECSTPIHYAVVKSDEYPELSVVDYLLWAVHRYLTKKEKRFF